MIEWIGIACVAWTATELLRMSAAALASTPARPAATRARRPDRPSRFAAWDERGRPIEVDDLGAQPRA